MPPPRPQPSTFWPALALTMTVVALVASGLAGYFYQRLAERPEVEVAPPVPTPVEPPEDRLILRPAAYSDLPGWEDDEVVAALPALRRSCDVFGRRSPETVLSEIAGVVGDWRDACAELLAAPDESSFRRAVEARLVPFQVLNNADEVGLFTGYYEPSLDGSRRRSERFHVPLYTKPADLVRIDLEQFHERFSGESISGRVSDGTFRPYFERAEIDSGALGGRRLELVWVDDPIDAFFLHIQGSGRVLLDDGSEMRVGYGGQNGRPYFAIGRELVDRGAMTLEEVSMQSIRSWLAAHPEEAAKVMATNPSYVFFRELEGEGPLGTMGVPLTPGRSLAVDRDFVPLGVPVWLDASAPVPDGTGDRPLRRLMVAQDTGGAIRGPVRGDVFWGYGPEAEEIAGRMKHEGRLWLLLPEAVAAGLRNGS